MFARESCSFCVKAGDLLHKTGADYKVINFEDEQRDVLEEIKKAHDWPTVPMIFYRNADHIEFVGGYTDLVEYLKNA